MRVAEADFDRMFEAIVEEPEPEPKAEVPEPAPSPAEPPPAQADPGAREDRVQAALSLFHRGEYVKCLAALRDLHSECPTDPRVAAFFAASRAVVMGEVREGLATCVDAVKRAFYLPDLYCALGVVLLKGGHRAKAHAAFRRGLRVDPKHPALRARLREMGVRRRPPLPFLRRSHPLNRALGQLRARVCPTG